jgi:hypothetical protein
LVIPEEGSKSGDEEKKPEIDAESEWYVIEKKSYRWMQTEVLAKKPGTMIIFKKTVWAQNRFR